MQNKWFFLVVFVLMLSAISIHASSTVEAEPIKNQITVLEYASFKLTITNDNAVKQRYSIYSLQTGQGWAVDTSPLKDRIVELDPGKTYTTTIVARPLEDFTPGVYYALIAIDSDQGERYQKSLKLYLASEKPLTYLPSIQVTLDMNDKIDPSQPVPVKISLENRNPLDLSGLKLRLDTEIPEFAQTINVDLPPLGKKTIELTLIPNRYQQPREYPIYFIFEREGQAVKILDKKVEILLRQPLFTSELKEETIVWKRFAEITIHNDGNVRNTQEVSIPLTFWETLFTRSTDGTVRKDAGQQYLVWNVELASNETTVRHFVTNYRVILYFLIVVLLLVAFYWYVRSPLEVSKKAVASKGSDEHVIAGMKITLELRNITNKSLSNVLVTDIVPAIANVESAIDPGTVKPKEIKLTQKGTKVVWSIAELEAGEHRLITYSVRTKFNVLGTFSLPRASVEFVRGARRKGKAYSNAFHLRQDTEE